MMSLEAGDGKRTNIYGDSDKGATREEEKEVNEAFQEKDDCPVLVVEACRSFRFRIVGDIDNV